MDIIDLHVSLQWKQLSNHRNKHCCGCFWKWDWTQEIVYKLISWDERMCAQHGGVIVFSEIWAGGMASSTSMLLPWWMEGLLRRLSTDLWKHSSSSHQSDCISFRSRRNFPKINKEKKGKKLFTVPYIFVLFCLTCNLDPLQLFYLCGRSAVIVLFTCISGYG